MNTAAEAHLFVISCPIADGINPSAACTELSQQQFSVFGHQKFFIAQTGAPLQGMVLLFLLPLMGVMDQRGNNLLTH